MRRAFTLIELCVVLVIMAIVLGLNFPNLKRAHAGIAVRRAADQIVYTMRYAKSRAITEGVVTVLVFSAEGYQSGLSGDDALVVPFSGKMGRRVVLPEGIRLLEPPEKVVFYPDGRIDGVRFEVTGDNGAYIITTEELPGHVSLLEDEDAAP